MKLVVLGMMGRCPFGGQSWLYVNWLSGLRRLGHEVWYVEDDTVWPYDPELNAVTDACGYAVRHIHRTLERVGLGDNWAYRLADREGACFGLSPRELADLYRTCDALLNIGGATDLRDEQLMAPRRLYIETDPVTAELRLANGDEHTRVALANHDCILTYGENYGAPDCGVPLNGISYRTTRQPVDLDLWPMAYDEHARSFTTIGNYRQEGSDVTWDGSTYYWSKHHEWQKIVDLPRLSDQSFDLAVMPEAQEDRDFLLGRGWHLSSPLEMSLDVFGAYPEFVRASRAEITVAKDQNVRLRSGWFSERDACYLASGKPVVAQDTGFGNVLPCGEGLFAFTDIDGARAAVDEINGDYRRHCDAARGIAQEYFEATGVARRLLTNAGLS